MDLSYLHQRRIAVVLQSQGQAKVLHGLGLHDCYSELGRVLRIQFNDVGVKDGFTEFTLREDQWSGIVTHDKENKYGCEYVIRLGAAIPSNAST